MWNNTSGYNNVGGGGFNSPGGGGFGTPTSSQERKPQKSKVQSFVPCTVAQIFNATMNNDRFFTADTEMAQITIIGVVRAVNQITTRLDYEIDDWTGPFIEVKQYVDNDESVPDAERTKVAREGTYVRVSGSIRSFQGKRHIVAFKIDTLTDMNELTCHLLEVIHAHAAMTKASTGSKSSDSNYGTGGMPGMNRDFGIHSFTDIQKQIHNIICNNPTDEGASMQSIGAMLRGYPEKNIRDAIEFLINEAHIYTTIDDDHFKATDM